ncbi:MAG: (Fe-S)-binding protein [Thermodesulfobacteriota bacterium]
MAHVILFPDELAQQQAWGVFLACGCVGELGDAPAFCREFLPRFILLTAGFDRFIAAVKDQQIQLAGIVKYRPPGTECPEAGAPDPQWKAIFGNIRAESLSPSITDQGKLRITISVEKSLGSVIPLAARLIRGASYRPEVPILAFEEDHRLIVISPREIVISRADDLMDFWIMLRTTVDFICEAHRYRFTVRPETAARMGVGATEIFRRLPGINCGRCGSQSCMEFASGLMTGKRVLGDCEPLFEESDPRYLASINWLLHVLGIPEHEPVSTDGRRGSSPVLGL